MSQEVRGKLQPLDPSVTSPQPQGMALLRRKQSTAPRVQEMQSGRQVGARTVMERTAVVQALPPTHPENRTQPSASTTTSVSLLPAPCPFTAAGDTEGWKEQGSRATGWPGTSRFAFTGSCPDTLQSTPLSVFTCLVRPGVFILHRGSVLQTPGSVLPFQIASHTHFMHLKVSKVAVTRPRPCWVWPGLQTLIPSVWCGWKTPWVPLGATGCCAGI